MVVYGIDLGTSNCSVAKVIKNSSKDHIVKTLKDKNGSMSFASVVHFENANSIIVGKKIDEIYGANSDNTVELVKTRMGNTKNIEVILDGKTQIMTPQSISAMLLKHINYSYDEKVDKAVITVPSFSAQNKREAIEEAAKISGIEVLEFIEEPSAAIMHHIFTQYKNFGHTYLKNLNNKNVLVFDFGGGTLDLSLVSVSTDNSNNILPIVKFTKGCSDLGGSLIDFEFTKIIVDLLNETYNDKFTKEVRDNYEYYYYNYKNRRVIGFKKNVSDEVKSFIHNLKGELERVKIALSNKESTNIKVGNGYKDIPVDREIFIDLVLEESGIASKIKDTIDEFNDENASKFTIDEIILVGGSSQIPYIKTILEEKFARLRDKIAFSEDYSYAVANGAAIVAAIRNGESIEPFGNNKCTGVVARNIYIEYGKSEQLFIESGTKYPFDNLKAFDFKVSFSLTPKISIRFWEKCNEGKSIVRDLISNLSFYHPCFYTGDVIRISLNVDDKGLYKFTATHVESGEEVEFEAEKEYSLTKNELQRDIQIVKSIKNIT